MYFIVHLTEPECPAHNSYVYFCVSLGLCVVCRKGEQNSVLVDVNLTPISCENYFKKKTRPLKAVVLFLNPMLNGFMFEW